SVRRTHLDGVAPSPTRRSHGPPRTRCPLHPPVPRHARAARRRTRPAPPPHPRPPTLPPPPGADRTFPLPPATRRGPPPGRNRRPHRQRPHRLPRHRRHWRHQGPRPPEVGRAGLGRRHGPRSSPRLLLPPRRRRLLLRRDHGVLPAILRTLPGLSRAH